MATKRRSAAKPLALDKYARDAGAWRDWGSLYHGASVLLLQSENLAMYIPAATVGHHALERYLKAALIRAGVTVCHPHVAKSVGIRDADYVWGHSLTDLADRLHKKQPDFDPHTYLGIPVSIFDDVPPTLYGGLRHFEPYFVELRYPQQLVEMEGVGQHEMHVLNRMVELLRPFSS